MRKHAEKERLREAQRAATHIPAAGDAKSIITCRVALLDGTDVSVDLPVRVMQVCFLNPVGLFQSDCALCSLQVR